MKNTDTLPAHLNEQPLMPRIVTPQVARETPRTPEGNAEQKEGKTFYIVTTLAVVTVVLLAIAFVFFMVYSLANQ